MSDIQIKGVESQAIAVNLELLKRQGWAVEERDFALPEFTAMVEFDRKTLRINIPSANLAHAVTSRVILDANHGRTGDVTYGFDDKDDVVTL